jgi:hypothetical protein
MGTFKNYFSKQSSLYSQFRPEYPPELYEYLSSICNDHKLAWDCATGNGQAARGISSYFKEILATDASAQQISNAKGPGNVIFKVADASASELLDRSVDIILVAHALHWFDLDNFIPKRNEF